MTVGSLFSGIGGFDLAAERVFGPGCVRWQVEIDPWAQRVLAKHWPSVPRFSDIREVGGDDLEPVDLVCGGFPCQPFSLAGKRMGSADERALWPEMCRVVSLLQPTWVVGENVPGLISMGLDQVCADLEALGYEVWTLGIPAVALGAPHRRQRLWIVAYVERLRCPAKAQRESYPAPVGDRENHQPRNADADAFAMAYSDRERQPQPGRIEREQWGRPGNGGADVSDANSTPEEHRHDGACAVLAHATAANEGRGAALPDAEFWAVEPPVGRVVDGLSGRVDRLRGLGNAIVPAVAEFLFRRILETAA